MTTRRRVVLVILAVLAAGSLWRMGKVEQEKRDIASAYQQAQELLAQVERERATLTSDLTAARETIDGQTTSLQGIEQELAGLKGQLSDTVQELASLQQAHEEARRENTTLIAQLTSVTEEKQQLEAKLSNLKDLRLAIKDVKRRIWAQRFEAWRARAAAQREIDEQELAAGNRGFVIKGGASTIASASSRTPRLHVHVLEPQSE